ncbi:hypothetical protein EKO27_g10171 [Xylaria grammica]|uniref:Uncharacterized protein n=1 Tax=Xylaria grammica TaxID=363999 RepID=A0A439CS19_9PEZI|nr:hypothetical protein EKO27_g10171 [Xylaria grammica]
MKVGEAAPIGQGKDLTEQFIESISPGFESNTTPNRTDVNRHYRLMQWVNDYWIWEFASWIVSSLLLAGVVLTLSLHQDQPLPEWPFGITINALISFLSSLSTSTLVVVISSIIGQRSWATLASAERPLRQLELNVTSIAGLVVIASLATVPFVQQITQIQLANSAVDTATIPALRNYANRELDDIFLILDKPLSYGIVPSIVTSGFYRGLYFSGNLSDTLTRNSLLSRTTCSTGNCTYPDFDSLAICSACANVTNQLSMSRGLSRYNNSVPQWTLPNGFAVDVDPNKTGLPVVNITAVQPCEKSDLTSCGATAQECTLYWCLNRYKSSVVQGLLYEDIMDTVKYGFTTNANLLENDTYVFQTNYTSLAQETTTKFNVSKWGSASLTDLIAETLTQEVFWWGANGTDAIEAVVSLDPTFPSVPLDMSPTFEALALSLTSAVCSYSHDEMSLRQVSGQALQAIPRLRVRWEWITLPFALQIISLLLLCYTVVKTSLKRRPVWKSSFLATVFFGVRLRSMIPDSVPNRFIDMKILADKIKFSTRKAE